MKKWLAMLLAIVMVLSTAACAQKAPATEAPKEEKTETKASAEEVPAEEAPAEEAPAEEAALPFEGKTLRVMMTPAVDDATDRAWFDKYLPEFEAATGATVDLTLMASSEISTKQKADLAAGDAADILTICGNMDYDYIKYGFIDDLTNMVSQELIDNNLFWEAKAPKSGGHYLVPFNGGLAYRSFFINTDLCKTLGLEIPEELTWDIMVDYSKKAIEAGYKGFVSPFTGNVNATWSNYFNYVAEAGGTLTGDDGMWDFTSPEALEAMTFIYNMHNVDKIIDSVSYDDQSAVDQWMTGDSLFLAAALYLVQPNIDTVNFDFEVYHLKNVRSSTVNVVDSLAINSASANKDLAVAFIEWFVSPETYTHYREFAPAASTLKNPAPEECMVEKFQPLVGTADYEVIPPSTPHASEIGKELISHQQLVAMGEETPEEALAALTEVVDGFREE